MSPCGSSTLSRPFALQTYPSPGALDGLALRVEVVHNANGNLLCLQRRAVPVLQPRRRAVEALRVGEKRRALQQRRRKGVRGDEGW